MYAIRSYYCTVWVATNVVLENRVAVKVLHREHALLDRFAGLPVMGRQVVDVELEGVGSGLLDELGVSYNFV